MFAFLCKTSSPLPGNNVSDHQALLSFKANLIGDPLRSWNESTHFCKWLNNLTGTFPSEFRSLSKLQYVRVVYNHLMGEIPAFLGNFSSLQILSFSGNNFKGKIPASFGCLPQLYTLSLFENSLTSTIPISIFNISSLANIDVQENQLQGYLPSNLGTTLPNLEYFNIGENLLVGRLPPSISNATSLWHYDVRYNGFIGGVPSFSGLKRLKVLALLHNPLGNGKSTDLNFLSSLLNSTASLLNIGLDKCNFGGVLPTFIGNFSNLKNFFISQNVITGDLPSEFHLLVNLQHLYLEENQLSGEIPMEGVFQNKTEVELGGNNLLCGEYGMGSAVSTLGDMYSYGILLLEIFTGKSPTSYIFNDCLNLHNYVKMAIPDHVVEIMDPKLFHKEVDATPATLVRRDQILECLVSIFEVGIACSVELPGKRMNIGCAIKELSSVNDNLMELGDFEAISL
nr:probable LRR receptor-like serine/threonine-protein kinase At3g47570 [Ipomoea batatas]